MKSKKLKLLFKPLSIIVLILIAIFFIVGYLNRFFKTADYFKIKEIIASGADSVDLSYLKGQNIFTFNLAEAAVQINELFPTYKKIRLVRILPNRIFVDFIVRRPIALVKLYRYFCVDEDSVLFDTSAEILEQDLPVITGLETKIFGPKLGRKYNVRELTFALDVIKETMVSRRLRGLKVNRIQVHNLNNASLLLNDKLEVKLGEDNIRDKINMLANMLIQLRKDYNNIKYIDLRFKEPVIKFNNVK